MVIVIQNLKQKKLKIESYVDSHAETLARKEPVTKSTIIKK